ncbi:MAG: ATP-dependent endonuclease [Pedococcus sp.]
MSTQRLVVLLEGRSDVAAVRALLQDRPPSVPVGQLDLVDMGGVTNIRRHLAHLVNGSAAAPASAPAPAPAPAPADNGSPQGVKRVLGVCDAGEASFFARALRSIGHPVASVQDMAALGFHVCDQDLEDELIRALGADRVIDVLADLELLDQFATFRRQPTWTGRPVTDQLRRFAGTTSGRKVLVAQALATAMAPHQAPPPLAALMAHIEAAATDPGAGPAVRRFPTGH